MKSTIINLARSPFYYEEWFEHCSDQEQQDLWQFVWDSAAQTHSGNEFVEGVYNFYDKTGYLTYNQFYHLINTVMPSAIAKSSLKDRIK